MVNPQITNLVIILGMMQVSKKIPFDDPNVLNGVRALYVVSNLVIVAIYLYTKMQIDKKRVLKYVEPAAMGSTEEPKAVTTTVHAYDTSQLKGLFKSQLMGGAFEGNLVKVHVLGYPASGDLKRPWKAAAGMMGMMGGQGGNEIKTDKKSIEAAEKAGRGGSKEE
ncbi:phosphate transporter (Pho88) [Friedmanniomyces endolithicus]|nr:phosphate transporter (Pho88) [Friedmanniomyces endolithicus]